VKMFNIQKAAAIQERLSRCLIIRGEIQGVRRVGAMDSSYIRKRDLVGAVIVVMELPGFNVSEVAWEVRKAPIPYIPGYLNFREGPAYLRAFRKLRHSPEVTLVDGNGIAHPRRMGLASYIGVILDIPTIGCAKSAFFPWEAPEEERGAYTLYRNREEEKVGFCLRSRTSVKPIFVSPGHRVSFDFAREFTLSCCRFRIPEPLRQAHLLARDLL